MDDVGERVPVAQEAVRQDLRAMFRGAIRASLELFLEAELESLVGAEWYARVGGRRDRRNGAYTRRLLTSLGQIDVVVPRSRESGSPANPRHLQPCSATYRIAFSTARLEMLTLPR